MDVRELFYWTASIVFILLGIVLIAVLALVVYIKRLASRTALKLDYHMHTAADTFRKYTWSRVILRALRMIF